MRDGTEVWLQVLSVLWNDREANWLRTISIDHLMLVVFR